MCCKFQVDRFVDFCFPGGIQESLRDQPNDLPTRAFWTVHNMKRLLELLTNFPGRFPYLHMPTFTFIESHDELILAIIGIRAAYSNRTSQVQVRNLMQRTKYGIERTSSIYHNLVSGMHLRRGTPSGTEFQELQALLMLTTQFTWHGGPADRATVQEESKRVFNFVKQHGPCCNSQVSAMELRALLTALQTERLSVHHGGHGMPGLSKRSG